MLKENWRLISRIERLGDLGLVVLCFFGAYYGRSSLIFWDETLRLGLPFSGEILAPVKDYFILLIVALLGYGVSLQLLGAYSSMRLSSPWRLLRISVLSSLMVFTLLATTLFVLKIDLSRSFVVLFCCLVALTLTAERYLILGFLRFWRRRGKNFRSIIICGIGSQAIRLARHLATRSELGIRIRAFADLRSASEVEDDLIAQFRRDITQATGSGTGRIIFGIGSVERALRDYAIDEVIFTDVVEVMPMVEEMVLICSERGVETTIAADLFSVGLVKSGISYFGDMPLIHFQTPPGDKWELALKRWVDIVGASILMILLSPLFLIISVSILLTMGRPVLFVQKRVGLNGRLFNLYKLRSMKLGAEHDLPSLLDQNEMSGPVFKMKEDPRVTRFGRFLRKYSFDELPQLWNVLMGDMSLVGPRPPIPGEVSLYERRDRRRLSMRPGMTCIWQVSGRNEIPDFEEWVRLDLEYIDNWSLSRDFLLLVRTIPAVIFGSGAR